MKFINLIVFLSTIIIVTLEFWQNCSDKNSCPKDNHQLICVKKDNSTEGTCLPEKSHVLHSCLKHPQAKYWCPEGYHCCQVMNKKWGRDEGLCFNETWSCQGSLESNPMKSTKKLKRRK